MLTRYGEQLDRNNVLQEYPRPQMRRESYINLNGEWICVFSKEDSIPDFSAGSAILVPFSPESELSGVNRALKPEEYLWYTRQLSIPDGFNVGRVLLHFGAVDQIATVYVNGEEICTHIGGYTPFCADITDALKVEDNTLTVRVQDLSDTSYHSRGKQKTKRGEIWYTPQSGIWQTVWLESVPVSYIRALRITPLFDEAAVELTVISDAKLPCAVEVDGKQYCFTSNTVERIAMDGFMPWSPENPHLYDLSVSMGSDRVYSYFGMRKFAVETDENGIKRLFLNGKPYFHNGLLDQGYYSDGMLTAPSDEAMENDIINVKAMGFNMLRKHIKLEPLRWYWHCDRLGVLVWQDMINGGGQYSFMTISSPLATGRNSRDDQYDKFARGDAKGREQYYAELDELVDTLYNSVCVCMWVPFNEGWGQFDAAKAVERILAHDTTRTIDHASGWHDQRIGDIRSIHLYFKKYRFKPDQLGRAVLLSEFGGYNLRIKGHCFNTKDYGYQRSATAKALMKKLRRLYEEEIIPAKSQGLCAAVYTQLTDVEDELNGLITYDRKVVKLLTEELRVLNARLSDGDHAATTMENV